MFPEKNNAVYTCSPYQKLNVSHQKTNVEQEALSYVGSSFRNNLNKKLRSVTNLNACKSDTKQHCFQEKRVLKTVFVFLTFQSKYIHFNFTIYMSLKSFLIFL